MADETNSPEESIEARDDQERRIRLRAYEIWEREGRPDGRADEHWLLARWELEQAPDAEAEEKRLEAELGASSESN